MTQPHPEALRQLLYVSRCCVPEPLVAALAARSAQRNAADGLSGVLLYSGGAFCQCLEGPWARVEATFARILQDGRHGGLRLLADGPARERMFSSWSMRLLATPAADDLLQWLLQAPSPGSEQAHRLLASLVKASSDPAQPVTSAALNS